MSYDLKNIYRPNSATPGNAGGILNRLILVKADDVETFPERDTDLVTLKENITMKSGKYMHSLYVTTKTAVPKQEKVEGANDDCGGFRVSVEFFHPGFEKPFQEFLAKFATGFNGYVIFEHAKTGRFYLIGEPGNEAVLKTSTGEWSGNMDGGTKGSTNTFEALQELPMAFYEGELALDPNETEEGAADDSGSSENEETV